MKVKGWWCSLSGCRDQPKASKGFAFVTFHDRRDAERAIKMLHGHGYDHLIISVIIEVYVMLDNDNDDDDDDDGDDDDNDNDDDDSCFVC